MGNEYIEDLVHGVSAFVLCMLILFSASFSAMELGMNNFGVGRIWFFILIVLSIIIVFDYWYYYRVLLKDR